LKKDVDKAKVALLEKKLLKLPGPDSVARSKATTIMRGTITMTMKGKANNNVNVSANGYNECDWNFSKVKKNCILIKRNFL